MGQQVKVLIVLLLMLKPLHLCASVKSNLGDRVLREAENNSFIASQRLTQSAPAPPKLCIPTQEDLVRSFIAIVQR